MRRLMICAVVCAWISPAQGAFERQPESVRSVAMGGAGVAIPGNPWGAFTNPAALAGAFGALAGVSLAPSPFGLTELGRQACACAIGWGRGGASIAALSTGFTLYRETTVAAAVGYDLGKGLRCGCSCSLNALSIEGYGSGSCWGCDAGILWALAPGVDIGASVQNLNAPSPGRSGEAVARSATAGIAVAAGLPATVAFDLAVDPRYPVELRLGGEYVIAGCVALRAGVSSDPSALCAGIGLSLSPVEVGYAFTRHQELGFTHRFGVEIHFGGP
ncbi:MAG TPA: hypothetical protein VL221_03955 [Bacteroidota bacterium]|nr:hypothetical protein [Bacteroidota bacterium]